MTFVKSPSSGSVYALVGGQKIPIGGMWVFDQLGIQPNIQTIPESQLNSYSTGPVANSASALQGSTSQTSGPAQAIIDPIAADLKRRQDEFMSYAKSNPFVFDEAQAKTMGEDRFNDYYKRVVSDFVKPLTDTINRSQEDLTKAVTELTRQTNLGQTQMTRDTGAAQENQANNAAANGLYGSGQATRSNNLIGIKGNENLTDYLAKSAYQQNNLQTSAQRAQADATYAIGKENRDIYGTPGTADTGQYGQSIQDYISQEKQNATKAYYTKLGQVGADTYGLSSGQMPAYLQYSG